jgi:glutamate synthase (NADPH/NADH) large chain
MTGGRVVVLGPTGRNFAAGMSGGVAFVYDKDRRFADRYNPELVDLEELTESDEDEVKALISEHVARTGSMVGRNVLASWDQRASERFVKVMPRDYRRALEEQAARAENEGEGEVIEATPQ